MLTTTDVVSVTQRQGVPDHQVLPVNMRSMFRHVTGGGGYAGPTHPPTHPPGANHPPIRNQKNLPLGQNELLNREAETRGPFYVHQTFFLLSDLPASLPNPCRVQEGGHFGLETILVGQFLGGNF